MRAQKHDVWICLFQSKSQKKLEAKKIREQMEEEERKQIEIEENNFKEQKRQEAIEKARTQHYYQTDRVRGLHVSVKHFTRNISHNMALNNCCFFCRVHSC